MDLNEFNDFFVNCLLDKLSKENKTVFLLDNFDQHSPTYEFLDSHSSHMLQSHIVSPPRIKSNFSILIDNIYSNMFTQIMFQITLLPQYLTIFPNFLLLLTFSFNLPSAKVNIIERVWRKLDQENLYVTTSL